MPLPDEKSFASTLTDAFKRNGIASLLNKEKTDAFYRLTRRMLEENDKFNLTAITEPAAVVLQHYVDCAVLASLFPKGASIADVGCGAGFPTLPLAIVRPDLNILAMDSTAKRVDYVAGTADLLGLSSVRCLCVRAEDAGRSPEYREKFDFAVARAVANLQVLCELCLPLVRVGGQMVAMKGKNAAFELRDAKKAISLLGGAALPIREILLKSESESFSHPLVLIDKKTKTPASYPRAFAQISKKPL